MTRTTPTAKEMKFVNARQPALVRSQRPRLHKFVGYVPPAPTNTRAPVIAGADTVGSTLTCTAGAWTGADTVTRQWRRDATNIAGATGLTYVLVAADSTTTVTCRETATSAGGSTQSTSNGIAVT
jgi:hypothetical protein